MFLIFPCYNLAWRCNINMKDYLKLYLKYPFSIIKTIYYCLKIGGSKFHKFHILASSKTKIKMNRNSKLHIGKRLELGIRTSQIGILGLNSNDTTLIQIASNGTMRIKNRAKIFAGTRILVEKNAKLEIGDNSFISISSLIIASESIIIGDNSAISWNVNIIDSDFHPITTDGKKRSLTKPINIGNKVLVCSGVTILKGVNIGDGAIVAAGSIVTKDVPPRTLVAGNPARVIKNNVDWE